MENPLLVSSLRCMDATSSPRRVPYTLLRHRIYSGDNDMGLRTAEVERDSEVGRLQHLQRLLCYRFSLLRRRGLVFSAKRKRFRTTYLLESTVTATVSVKRTVH